MRLVLGLWLALVLGAAEVVKEADARAIQAMVSFLASDALEGRDTPSAGLTVASEYIASEFRRTGLKTSFQEAKMLVRRVERKGFTVSLTDGQRSVSLPVESAIWTAGPKVDLTEVTVGRAKLNAIPEKVEPVMVLEGPAGPGLRGVVEKLAGGGAKVIVLVGIPMPLPAQTVEFDDQPQTGYVMLRTTNREVEEMLKTGAGLKASIHIEEAAAKADVARNVIGVLEGSDPKLKEEYVLLTAHYDHLGVRPNDTGDKVYNGANDNASGVASIIESARLLAGLKVAPKRSVMFVAFFGEERGLLGSRYFARHPAVPLKQMVANLNLEQTGRTDSSEGPNVGQVNLTGYHFTTIHKHMEAAGEATGLKVVKHEKFSDPYFMASDNAALAAVGIPSTTLSVTYAFPDYHQKGDEAGKIDYENMARVTRAIAQGTYLTAEAAERVSWNADEVRTKLYREAAAKLQQ
jgi:hypothetical protein